VHRLTTAGFDGRGSPPGHSEDVSGGSADVGDGLALPVPGAGPAHTAQRARLLEVLSGIRGAAARFLAGGNHPTDPPKRPAFLRSDVVAPYGPRGLGASAARRI
jgi:hypothetical protein